ncbi:MAG: 16S rRNA (guanine(527)-N(7))-methyltransferase RsmG, partial [Anaerolineae bacterium]|nr:16S rRNA (guanine(527)-N(7))-methyltransferase RsmG [Anaerolineae bacterium]NIP71180.1 16S rRNA (guanine(527)-N(7))-methyltransferase RsmG [Planctomycetales bacterium]
AGIPGIPLKLLLPDIRLVLLDATKKKADFLEHVIQRLELKDIEIVVGRAEEIAHLSEYREQFEIVLSRAVAGLPTLVELTLPFCAIGGRLIAQKKGSIQAELEKARQAIPLLGGALTDVKRIELPEFTDKRWLVVVDKVGKTPPQYPRRPGIPAKRPLL